MNRVIKAQLALEERRKALGILIDIPTEDRSEDYAGKLEEAKAGIATSQAEMQTAAEAEPDPVPTATVEGREVLELRERSTLAGFVQGFHAGKVEGAEAELRAAVLGDNFKQDHVPLEMLMPRSISGLEERAVTPVAAAARTEGNQQTIAARVFKRSIPTLLGIPMPTVAAGAAGYPRLSGGTTFSMQSKSQEQAAVAGTFSGDELLPLRGTGSYEFRIEDVAELIGTEDAVCRDGPTALDGRT